MKTVIITGAGSGIGKALAKKMALNQWKVTLNGRTRKKLEQVAEEIDQPENINIFEGDVSDRKLVQKLIENHISKFERLDGLVNNAGVVIGGNIDEVSYEDWRKVMNVNVDSIFHTIGLSVKYLEKTQGAIVNVSSVSGISGDWGMSPYNTSKGAVSNLTKSLALDLASKGIRVNAVAPSLTNTPMASFVIENEEIMKKFKERIPLGRSAEPSEVADVIAFLLSREARFVNGVILPVDGGLTASNGQPKLF